MSESHNPSLIIAHVSDLHLGAHDPDAVATLAADVAAVRPTLTVVTGDCTMRARVAQFRAARDLIDRLPAPRLVVIGNHDVPLISLARVVAPYARFRRWISADLDPVLRLDRMVVLGLQTTPRWRWKSGRVSRRQADAVRTVLGAAPAAAVRVLALHHPPRATGLARLVGRKRLARLSPQPASTWCSRGTPTCRKAAESHRPGWSKWWPERRRAGVPVAPAGRGR
jgi:3',5'-cyclic AMP phosphodiesterase CpdA